MAELTMGRYATVLEREDLVRQDFEASTAEHKMSILRDDGLYRHVRFKNPDGIFYYYDLVTWPGYLAFVGDAGDYVFSRIRDMFEFFRADGGGINPHYWAQKLQAPRGTESARSYTEEALRRRLREWAHEEAEYADEPMYPSLVVGAVDRLLDGKDPDFLFPEIYNEHGAVELLHELELEGIIYEPWEWDVREYDRQFLWACWAITKGIARYDEASKEAKGG